MVSERDYARKVILMGRARRHAGRADHEPPVITVTPEEQVRRCMELMTGKRIATARVDAGGRMVGLVSIGDLVRA